MTSPMIIAIVVLVIFSAFFSATEIAYTLVNEKRLKKAVTEGVKGSSTALLVKSDYNKLIQTILIGNNICNITTSTLATALATSIWGSTGQIIATVGTTLILLTFGEILPKTIVVKIHYRYTLAVAKIVRFFEIILKPFVYAFNAIIKLMSPLWTKKRESAIIDEHVLESMVDEIEEEGFIDEDTGELLRSTIDFTTSAVYEIMQPRVDVFGFDISEDIQTLVTDGNIFKYSRIPVYEDSMDHIVGILNTKKIIRCMLTDEAIDLPSLLTPPIFVHKTKSITSLLKDFKQTKTHIAVVVDEFGGTMGIVTLEDIIEELVGDIWDEGDDVEEEYQENASGVFLIDGDMNIYDFFDVVDYNTTDFDSEYSTVGGWCTEVLERFPKEGDEFTFENFHITVLEVNGLRVEKIKVEVIESDIG